MPDFRTPLPIHRAAFARIAPGLDMAPKGIEALRTAYQAADRSGDPKRLWRNVSDVLAEEVWRWPWMEQCAADLRRRGLWPHDWIENKIAQPLEWSAVSHAARTRLMLATLGAAVFTTRQLADFQALVKDGVIRPTLTLKTGDQRCGASIAYEMEYKSAVEAGDFRALPPFFPGDATSVRIEFPSRRR